WNLGEPPHEGTQKILNKHNIPFDGMISELFEATDDFDYIVAMTNEEKVLAIREKLNIVNQGLLDPEKYKNANEEELTDI
ncbi:DUF1128 family protein, partial [Staphylococcus sp. EG-SA-23]|uniref:DUF1128 family protein n=1 Tax=Staphylococcus sp. EG-SA-23 TaxID=2767497 RepID=UPI00237B0103